MGKNSLIAVLNWVLCSICCFRIIHHTQLLAKISMHSITQHQHMVHIWPQTTQLMALHHHQPTNYRTLSLAWLVNQVQIYIQVKTIFVFYFLLYKDKIACMDINILSSCLSENFVMSTTQNKLIYCLVRKPVQLFAN